MPRLPLPPALALAALLAGPASALADFTFVHASDTHVGASAEPPGHAADDARLFAEIAALDPRPAFVVNTGDVAEIATPAEYETWRAIQPALAGVPIYSAPGNHDVRWNPLGKAGFTQGTGQPLYQSWDHENLHFVTLDSTVLLNHVGHVDAQQLQWLKDDLAKVGTEKPVVIGFHHWVGRDAVMVDNERELLDAVAPYNVVLWLQGHGHSHIDWSVEGAPAVMVQGLYQGSYGVVDVTDDTLTYRRRVPGKADAGTPLLGDASTRPAATPATYEELLTVPLARANRPEWSVRLAGEPPSAEVVVDAGDLPPGTELAYRLNTGGYRPAADAGTTPADGSPDAGATPPAETKAVPSTRSAAAVARAFAAGAGADLPALSSEVRFAVDLADADAGRHDLTVRATTSDGRTYARVLPVTVSKPDAPTPLWTTDVGGAVQSAIVRRGDRLFVTSMDGGLSVLSTGDGEVAARQAVGGSIFSAPLVIDDAVYVGSADGHVYAFDAPPGEPPTQRWSVETGGAVFSGPAVATGVVCAASVDRTVYGLDARTGEQRWTAPVGGMVQSRVATDGESFYIGGWDNRLRKLDATTGAERWSVEMGRSAAGVVAFYFAPAIAAPTVADVPLPDGTTARRVFVASNDGVLHAVSAETGETAWTYDGKKVGYSSPLYHDGKVYAALGDAGAVFCFDAATGETVWESSAGSTIYDSSFAHADGRVFIATVAGVLNAFDAATGELAWRYRLATGHTLASPAAGDGRVYASGMSGDVVALPTRP